jgi:hypothetical protein
MILAQKGLNKILLLFFLIMISLNSKSQTCAVDFDYTISGDTVTFQNLSPNVIINDVFEWNLGDGTIVLLNNLLHSYTTEGVYNVCLKRTNILAIPPCVDSICKEVVFCVDCVWPGDANKDKTANNVDVLNVGVGYGSTGASRTMDTTTNWAEKVSSILWVDINSNALDFINGSNYKHADCDGNGVIDEADLLPIERNYDQTHNKRRTPACVNINDVPLYFEISYDSIEVSSVVQIAIKLGTVTIPAVDAYGIAFTLSYDAHLIDSNNLSINYDSTGFKIAQSDTIIKLNKYFKTDGQIETAVCRTNQTGKIITGETIGVINFVMEDNLAQKRNNLTDYLHLSYFDVYLIASDETLIPVCAFTDSVLVYQKITGMNKMIKVDDWKIYPNPSNNLLNIETNKDEILSINIINLLGENIFTHDNINAAKISLSLEGISEGMYFVEIESKNGYGLKKFFKH